MRKMRFLAAGTLALFMASLGGVMTSDVAAQDDPRPVTPRMTVTQSGNLATFVILVQNNRREVLRNVEIKAPIPEGMTITSSWAGSGPGNAPGRFTGGDRAIGWINTNTPVGRAQGPFVFTLDTGGQMACSYVWVRVAAGELGGTAVSDQVCTPAPGAGGAGGG